MLNLTFHLHSPVPHLPPSHHPNYHCFVSSYITERRADNNKHPLSWHLLIIRVTFIFFLLLFLYFDVSWWWVREIFPKCFQVLSIQSCFHCCRCFWTKQASDWRWCVHLVPDMYPGLWGKLHSDSFLFSHVTAKYDCWLPALCVSTWLHDYCLLQLCFFFYSV